LFVVLAQVADQHRMEGDVGLEVGRVALAKAAEGLASTIEHMINVMARSPTVPPRMKRTWDPSWTLRFKLIWLWSNARPPTRMLRSKSRLTKTTTPYAVQRAAIARLRGGALRPIVHLLLETLLARNYGVHDGFVSIDRDGLFDVIQQLLRGCLVHWRQAKARGIV
jgi:hypothetical protein